MLRPMRSLVVGLLVLGACGDDGVHHLPDAPPGQRDGGVDAAGDAAIAPVTVTVTNAGAPVAGVTVFFQNPDQSEVATVQTDSAGIATALMPHGGFVTALDAFGFDAPAAAPGRHYLRTWVDVVPGDSLHLDGLPGGDPPPVATLKLTVPQDTFAVPASYRVFSQCGQTTVSPPLAKRPGGPANGAILPPMTGAITMYPPCGATADFVVVDYDDAGQPLNYLYLPSVPVTDATTVDFTALHYGGTGAQDVSLTMLPATTSSVFYELRGLGPSPGSIYLAATANPAVTGTTATFQVQAPPADATFGYAELGYLDTSTTGSLSSEHQFGRWNAVPASDYPAARLADFTSVPTIDATGLVAWTMTPAPAATPTFYAAALRDGNADGSVTWLWQNVGKYTGTGLVYPRLPNVGADFNPVPGDGATVTDLYLADAPGGWDAVRPIALDLFDQFGDFSLDRLAGSVAAPTDHFEFVGYYQNTFTKHRRSRPH